MSLILGRIGWDLAGAASMPPADPHTWYNALSLTLDLGDPAPINNQTLRMRFSTPPLQGPAGDHVRIRLRGSNVALSVTRVNEAWIGKVAKATSGTPMNDGVRLTFNNGSAEVVIGTNGEEFSDAEPFVFNPETHDLIVSLFIQSGTNYAPDLNPAPTGVTGINVSGNSASSSLSLGAGTTVAWIVDLIQGNAEYVPPEVPYSPPAGDNVTLNFTGTYSPPAGDNVTLNFDN